MRHAVEKREEMRYDGGVEEFVKYLDRNKKPMVPAPIMISAEMNGIGVEAALWWNDSYHENVLCFTNNIPQRDGGTHLAGFRGALTRQVNGYADANAKKRKDRADRRRLPRGPDRGALGEGARSEILVADQGQAGVLGSAPGGRERHQRGAGGLVRGTSGRGQGHRRQGGRGGRRPRSRAQGARTDAAQGRATMSLAARQARRLPGKGSRQVRTVHRRGRLAPAAAPSRAATANSRRCCRCAARSSMSSARASTRCWAPSRSAR